MVLLRTVTTKPHQYTYQSLHTQRKRVSQYVACDGKGRSLLATHTKEVRVSSKFNGKRRLSTHTHTHTPSQSIVSLMRKEEDYQHKQTHTESESIIRFEEKARSLLICPTEMLPRPGTQSRRDTLSASVTHFLVPLQHVRVPPAKHLQPFLLPPPDDLHGHRLLTAGGGGRGRQRGC